jgi:alkylhydroperoxidase/carboxymuconolactone decarboxylase family protein YurZ
MRTSVRPDHRALAETLRRRVLEGPGETRPALRQASAERAAGGPAAETPYDELVHQIGEAAHGVTDTQVSDALAAAGNEKAVFEIIAAAAVGAGLFRWRQAIKVLEEASDASE